MSTVDLAQELPKSYDPAAVEAQTYRVWLEEKCFEADPAKPGEPYSIVIPPPNVTGALHLGHAINNTLQDILTRVHRMRGFNTVWIPGIDHAGIATQAVVEKQLKEKENKTRHDVGRECLVKRIWAWKQQYGDRILMQLQRLGCSCDWSRTRFTLDDMCARAVRETFFKLFKDGLVYRGKRLVNWDTHLLTSISDDELYTETVKTSLWSIKYPIDGTDDFVTVATTRPETMLADTAVAYHSSNPKAAVFKGKSVRLPLTNRLVPLIEDDILVDPEFGTGYVKVTPAHDPNDYAVYQRHLGKPTEIGILNLMTPDGKVNDADPSWQQYTGLSFAQARKKIVDDLATGGFHNPQTDVKPHEANVSFSDRSKTAIQPYLSDQWFVRMAPLAEPALEVVRDGTIKFFPERHAQQYLSWLGEKRDWPISRQLWWGHRIPVWKVSFDKNNRWIQEFQKSGLRRPTAQGFVASGIEGLFSELESEQVPRAVATDPNIQRQTTREDRAGGFVQDETDHVFFCSPTSETDAVFQQLAEELSRKAEGKPVLTKFGVVVEYITAVEQDPDVLDTWFSSALWPHSTLGWPEQSADLARWYPTSVLMTGRDIITLWVARMVMMGMYNMGKSTMGVSPMESNHGRDAHATGIPFHHVAINPTILDGKGERMSKSKGNGVDPVDIIDTHGADALRFTLTQMATETQDARMPVQAVCPHCGERFDNPEGKAQIVNCPKCKKPMTRPFENAAGSDEAPLCKMTSKRFDEGRNFCTKLWNAGKFVLSNLESSAGMVGSPTMGAGTTVAETTKPVGSLADRWIVSRFNRAVEESNAALATYRFDQYAKACYDFFWRDFCDWYVEAAKPAMKDPARSTATANTLATVLDGVLRLMHPMIPFITERLWWQLNAVRPADRSRRLIHATWPAGGAIDSEAEAAFEILQGVIAAIRNVRNEYKIDPKKPVTVSLAVPTLLQSQISDSRELIETLATCSLHRAEVNLPMPANAARATVGGIDVFVEGVIDPDAEKTRLTRQRETLVKDRDALIARLANPSYADKAPPHLVQQTRDKLAAVEEELRKVEIELTKL
jgi:valyl-tRNA synthetase